MSSKVKKFIIILAVIIIGLFSFYKITGLSESSMGWTYVKFENKLYVINTDYKIPKDDYNKYIGDKLGTINNKVPNYFKPASNSSSNGFPVGTELYRDISNDGLIVKFNNNFYSLCDTSTAEGWGNGIIIKVKGDKLVY